MQHHDTNMRASARNENSPIDWALIAEIIPPLVNVTCWALWLLFLLIPSLYGYHYAALFSPLNNAVFVLMGFTLCTAIHIAIRATHGARAIVFASGLILLTYWF